MLRQLLLLSMFLLTATGRCSADAMYIEFNGKPYSSMAAEKCIVMFIKDVSFLDDSSAARGGRPNEVGVGKL